MEDKSSAKMQIIFLAVGEVAVSAIICLVYFLLGKFDTAVVLGALLGSVVTVLNFLFLTVTVNREVDKYLALRKEREMSEEEAEAFAREHTAAIQMAATRSFIIRTISMLAALVAAFLLTDLFLPLATAIPLLMFRPLLYVLGLIKKKGEAKK